MQRLWSIVDQSTPVVDGPKNLLRGLFLGGAATGLSKLSEAMLSVELPFAFGLVAVVLGAAWGGALPALVVAGVTIPSALALSDHHPLVTPINVTVIALFSITLAFFGGRMRTLQRRAETEAL